jgi:hypothetical protein
MHSLITICGTILIIVLLLIANDIGKAEMVKETIMQRQMLYAASGGCHAN